MDEALQANLLMQIAQYGQTPSQLLNSPHPIRPSRKEHLASQTEGIPAGLLSSGVIPQKVLRTKHKTAITSMLFQKDRLIVMDSVGRCSVHSILGNPDASAGLPLEIQVSDKHTKRTVSGVTVRNCD